MFNEFFFEQLRLKPELEKDWETLIEKNKEFFFGKPGAIKTSELEEAWNEAKVSLQKAREDILELFEKEKLLSEKRPGDLLSALPINWGFWNGCLSMEDRAKRLLIELKVRGVTQIESAIPNRPKVSLSYFQTQLQEGVGFAASELELFIKAAGKYLTVLGEFEDALKRACEIQLDIPVFGEKISKVVTNIRFYNNFPLSQLREETNNILSAIADCEKPCKNKCTCSAKDDAAKLRLDLVPPEWVKELAEVLSYGAKKYAPESWRSVEPDRYEAALLRHVYEYLGNRDSGCCMKATDDGLHPLVQAAVNCLFIYTLRGEQERGANKTN